MKLVFLLQKIIISGKMLIYFWAYEISNCCLLFLNINPWLNLHLCEQSVCVLLTSWGIRTWKIEYYQHFNAVN